MEIIQETINFEEACKDIPKIKKAVIPDDEWYAPTSLAIPSVKEIVKELGTITMKYGHAEAMSDVFE